MQNPLGTLENEHEILFKAIETGKGIQKISDDSCYHELMHDYIICIRNYTELIHYPKEEQVLYPLLRDRTKNMSAEFMHEICDNHEDFKSMLAEVENLFTVHDHARLRKVMNDYLDELAEHLHRENVIILSAARTLLSETEKKEINQAFSDLDAKNRDKANLQKCLSDLAARL